jgi:hypothetical protein
MMNNSRAHRLLRRRGKDLAHSADAHLLSEQGWGSTTEVGTEKGSSRQFLSAADFEGAGPFEGCDYYGQAVMGGRLVDRLEPRSIKAMKKTNGGIGKYADRLCSKRTRVGSGWWDGTGGLGRAELGAGRSDGTGLPCARNSSYATGLEACCGNGSGKVLSDPSFAVGESRVNNVIWKYLSNECQT